MHHNSFIKGLREIKMESAEEALPLLRIGVQSHHVAATRLNYHSSWSHSIFTIKILRFTSSGQRPKVACINRLSINSNNGPMVHNSFHTRCTHSYHLTRTETGKICFKSRLIHLISILDCTDWFPSCTGVGLYRSKWLTICSIKVRSISLWFEADFGSLNTGKTVTVCVYCTGSCKYRIIAPLLLCWLVVKALEGPEQQEGSWQYQQLSTHTG